MEPFGALGERGPFVGGGRRGLGGGRLGRAAARESGHRERDSEERRELRNMRCACCADDLGELRN
jgi:hypothetical protein